MKTVNYYMQKQLFESQMPQYFDGRDDIKEFANELFEALQDGESQLLKEEQEYQNILLEQDLTDDQLKQLFTQAAEISKGGKFAQAFDKVKAAGKASADVIKKLNDIINKHAKKLQDTKPVQNFDGKVDQILKTWKEKLGADHKAVKMAQKFGDLGKKHPGKTAFIIGALVALGSVLGAPGVGFAVGMALRTAVGLMKGEKASTAAGKALKVAAVGSLVGMGADAVADLFQGASDVVMNIKQAFLGDEVAYVGGDYQFIQSGTSVPGGFAQSNLSIDHYVPVNEIDKYQEMLQQWKASDDVTDKQAVADNMRKFLSQFSDQQDQLQDKFQAGKETAKNITKAMQGLAGATTASVGGAAASKAEKG